MINFEKEILTVMGEPISDINQYIDFVLRKSDEEQSGYIEVHHLLPKSKFEKYSKDERNLFRLEYKDHIQAHILLARCYPIQEFITPLNFLRGVIKKEGYSEIISKRAKKGWEKLKLSDNYSSYCETQRLGNGKWNFSGNESYERVRKAHNEKWNNISEEYRLEFSNKMKQIFKDPEVKERHTKSIHGFTKTDEFRDLQRELVQKRWDKKSPEERQLFKDKMVNINQDQEKRKDASLKIKKKWEDPMWRKKMEGRKSRPKQKYKILYKNREENIFGLEKLSDVTGLSKFILNSMISHREKRKEKNGEFIEVIKIESN